MMSCHTLAVKNFMMSLFYAMTSYFILCHILYVIIYFVIMSLFQAMMSLFYAMMSYFGDCRLDLNLLSITPASPVSELSWSNVRPH